MILASVGLGGSTKAADSDIRKRFAGALSDPGDGGALRLVAHCGRGRLLLPNAGFKKGAIMRWLLVATLLASALMASGCYHVSPLWPLHG